jgi:hypothetical protein
MDMAARGPVIDPTSSVARAGAITIESLRANIAALGSPPVQRVLLTALDSAEGDLQKAQANIEAWYDASMERVSGWYKRSTQVFLFFIGLGVAITLNINTITIANYLYRDSAARAALVARAEAAVAEQNYPRTYPAIQTELQSLKLPIGWESGLPPLRNSDGTPRPNTVDWIGLIGGLLMTALAATLGAPFWFDILNKVMVIRSTVKPHEKSPEEASKDRQPAKAAAEPTPERPAATPSTPAAPTPVPPAPSPEAARATEAASQHPDNVDGCDVDFLDFTPDEELPAAEGGVA